jgi:hypothetical protein
MAVAMDLVLLGGRVDIRHLLFIRQAVLHHLMFTVVLGPERHHQEDSIETNIHHDTTVRWGLTFPGDSNLM